MTTTTTPLIAPDAPEYVTIKEAADALGLKPWPVAQLVESGDLPAVRFGKALLVPRENIERLGGVLDEGEYGDACQRLLREATRRCRPDVADALDAGDPREAARRFLEGAQS
jgi:excisionase family DNA binding protein